MDAAAAAGTSIMKRSRAAPEHQAEFDAFYAGNIGQITAQMRAYTGDHAEAEDIAAEAFCRALIRWKILSRYDNPATWVRRVAWNLATSRLRRGAFVRRFTRRQHLADVEGPGPDRVDLERALAQLGERHRKAIILHYIAGMSGAEIADQEQVAESTVRTWLARGRAALAERLRIDESEEQQ
ncbi:sigma-70 family RNA polymerase sigma factor [Glycomyces harbinensis]|uniref:RNA polymerase sigma-70 factor, ECF subfamily n=1 Tax=Glycomyces harbinensis TaxID=58114 RepID=A0A1G7CUD9_9ACTN|nr:sigma-70 family RNA polymerase sigma factor [Glycomyces harbinensis]SDE42843.1 RNA polymerase sigma-70 factor, ECF subfamily [Glycomyces harbinensis]